MGNDALARILASTPSVGRAAVYDPPAQFAGRTVLDGPHDLIVAGYLRKLREAGITGPDRGNALAAILAAAAPQSTGLDQAQGKP